MMIAVIVPWVQRIDGDGKVGKQRIAIPNWLTLRVGATAVKNVVLLLFNINSFIWRIGNEKKDTWV